MSAMSKEAARRACGILIATALRAASRPYRPLSGCALIIAPHADDEILGCGGLIAAKAQAGHDVQVVFLTDGSASHPDHPVMAPAKLADRRYRESLDAIAMLGVSAEHAHFLGVPDGTLDRLSVKDQESIEARLADLMRRSRPTEVFVTWRDDGSTEHAAACRMTESALATAGGGVLMEYPIWAWWNPMRLKSRLGRRKSNLKLSLGSLCQIKRQALSCHRTQIEPTPPWKEPVLPLAVSRSCCGPEEFFFYSLVPSDSSD
jgi:N-acetylglucosamine malate deacetylase 1